MTGTDDRREAIFGMIDSDVLEHKTEPSEFPDKLSDCSRDSIEAQELMTSVKTDRADWCKDGI